MRANKQQLFSKGLKDNRQKITVVVFVIVVLIILWQVIGIFRGSRRPTPALESRTTSTTTTRTTNAPGVAGVASPMPTPIRSQLPKPQALTANEIELLKLQQETQARYLAALNQLQMLKVSREIVETNLAIVNAKLATITAEKNIVHALTPPAPPPVPVNAYSKGLENPSTASTAVTDASSTYTVVSVSLLEGRWTAVLGNQGNLYNVHVGDIMPADGSKVIAINRNGVVISKDGQTRRISLVPII